MVGRWGGRAGCDLLEIRPRRRKRHPGSRPAVARVGWSAGERASAPQHARCLRQAKGASAERSARMQTKPNANGHLPMPVTACPASTTLVRVHALTPSSPLLLWNGGWHPPQQGKKQASPSHQGGSCHPIGARGREPPHLPPGRALALRSLGHDAQPPWTEPYAGPAWSTHWRLSTFPGSGLFLAQTPHLTRCPFPLHLYQSPYHKSRDFSGTGFGTQRGFGRGDGRSAGPAWAAPVQGAEAAALRRPPRVPPPHRHQHRHC